MKYKNKYDDIYKTDVPARWEISPSHEVFYFFIKKYIHITENILEIGCGRGVFLAMIQKVCKNHQLHGIDISKEAIVQGRKIYPHLHLDVQNACQLDYSDNWSSLTFSIGCFEHFEDPQKALLEMSRTLRPGGKFMLLMPTLGVDPLGLTDIGREDEGWYEEKIVTNGFRQFQWNFRRSTWEKMFIKAGLHLYPVEFSSQFGAINAGVFYCGEK